MTNPTELPQTEAQTEVPQPEFAPVPAAQPKKKTGVVVLAIILVLAFGGAATFGVLYANEKSARTEQIAAKDKEIAELGKKAKDAEAASTKASDERRKLENDAAEMKKCNDAASKFAEAALSDNEAAGREAIASVLLNC